MTDLLIKGGTVYTPDGPRDADLHVSDGVITKVEAGRSETNNARVIADEVEFEAELTRLGFVKGVNLIIDLGERGVLYGVGTADGPAPALSS